MSMPIPKRHFLAGFLFVWLCVLSWGVQAETISADWPLLSDYQKLIACRAIPTPFYGQRIWTTETIAEQMMNARESIRLQSLKKLRCSDATVQKLLGRFDGLVALEKKHFEQAGPYARPFERVGVSYNWLAGNTTDILPANQRGSIDAAANSFFEDRDGRFQSNGHSLSLESAHELSWGRQRFFAQPHFDVTFARDLGSVKNTHATLLRGYGLLRWKNLQVLLGRDSVIWGQGEYGGLLFSENARPLDHFQMTNEELFRMPWIFSHLGRWKFTYIGGTLGPEQVHPWNFFTGLSIGLKPSENVELNISHIFQFGGTGSLDMTPGQGFREFFGFIPLFSQTTAGGTNKITVANIRVHIPPLRMQTYFEYLVDDSNISASLRAIKKHITHNSAYKLGAFLPCLTQDCMDSARLEVVTAGPIAYRHGDYQSGWTENRDIIGDPAGPDSWSARFSWLHEWSSLTSSRLDLRWTKRDSNTYIVSADGLTVSVAADNPAETRSYAAFTQTIHFEKFHLKPTVGLEYVANTGYVAGVSNVNGLVGIGLDYFY